MEKRENSPNAVDLVMESVFEHYGLVPSFMDNKAIDFPIHSVVRCTYLHGLFRVIGYTNHEKVELVVVSSISNPGEDNRFMSPKFIEKTSINEESLKVLF